MLVFLRRGENRSTRRKTFRSKGENKQQTQPTYGIDAGIWIRVTIVGGERSHHCVIPCSTLTNRSFCMRVFRTKSKSRRSHRHFNLVWQRYPCNDGKEICQKKLCCLLRLFSRFRRCYGCAWYATIWAGKPTIWWEIRDDIDVRRCPLTEAHKFVNKFNLYTFKLKGPCYDWLGNSANYSSSDTGWQNLRNYMRMMRPAIRVKQVCLPHIISNITNNKNALWKTVRLTRFHTSQLQSDWIFFKFVRPCLVFYSVCYLYVIFMFLAVIFMFHPFWWQIPSFEFWEISWHSCLTGMRNCTICSKRVASHWYLETFIFNFSKFVVVIHVCLFHPKPS